MDIFWKIFASVVSAGIIAFFGWVSKQIKDMKKANDDKYKDLLEKSMEIKITDRLQPFITELTSLKLMIQDAIEREEELKSELLTSYKFRLMQLCREVIAQGYITQAQYDHLSEFYKLYSHLGGNGQGEEYYKKAISLDMVTTVQHPQDVFNGNTK